VGRDAECACESHGKRQRKNRLRAQRRGR
jgi:hypothetical protein